MSYPVIGGPRKFFKRFKFVIEIDGVGSAAFQSCSELSAEVAKVEHYEGGAIIPDKTPGRVTIADVTLERGATVDQDVWSWFSEVWKIAAGVGLPDHEYKRDADVVQLDRDGSEMVRWRLRSAWPQKFVAGAWDNTADENVIESVTLAIDWFERIEPR